MFAINGFRFPCIIQIAAYLIGELMGSTEFEAFLFCLAKVPVLGIAFFIEYPVVNRCFARGEITDSIFRIRFVDSNIRSGVFPFFLQSQFIRIRLFRVKIGIGQRSPCRSRRHAIDNLDGGSFRTIHLVEYRRREGMSITCIYSGIIPHKVL